MEGWIKLHRQLLKHWIWKNDQYLRAWIYCLFRANHESNKILLGSKLQSVERGQFITSIGNFAKDTGLTVQGVRTFWWLLENDKMITKTSTSKSTKLTICNYDSYQTLQQTNNKPVTNVQQTLNKPVTTDKKVKKEKQLKEFKEEASTFSEYDSEMIKEFIDYWTEENHSKTKFRFQLEKTWSMKRRLATWQKRSLHYKPESKNLYPGYTDSSFD